MSVDDLLTKADSRLTAAARDVEAGDVERSLSASYYAMFYAASAALEKVGVSRAKHSAIIAAFGEQRALFQYRCLGWNVIRQWLMGRRCARS